MRRIILLVFTALNALQTFAQNDSPKVIELTANEKEFVQGNNQFAFNLFRAIRDEKSQFVSPLSLTFALGMINNGGSPQVQSEISGLLGFGDAGADAINAFCRKMLDETASLDERTLVRIANNIYMNYPAILNPTFVEQAAQYYDASPETRDFRDGKTRDAINQWGSDHTEGMIEEILKEDDFDPSAVSYLLNALYFKGEWTHQFDAESTYTASFDHGNSTVEMMYQESGFQYAETELFQSVVLPYGAKAYQMTIFLPKEGKSIDDVLNTLNGQNWNATAYRAYKVKLALPRFETASDLDLKAVLGSLGMPTAFARGNQFPGFCNVETFISLVKQSARIQVNEEGSEAAAVTVIVMSRGGDSTRTFEANRPFFYVISEQSTGVILFMGQFMGNANTKSDEMNSVSEIPSVPTHDTQPLYNLSGQRIKKAPHHGIYIQDGRKVLR